MKHLALIFLTAVFAAPQCPHVEDSRPNILWITIEDWGPDLSCYGTKGIHTPHVDRLASQGIRYKRAFTTSPVCSTSRSAMMTGYHQNYIGANQHREHDKQPLPYGVRPIPHLMQDAGYFTALMSWKTDCNFVPNKRDELFMGEDWSERDEDQPFFARITFGGTHRHWIRDPARPIGIDDVELPPYYPDTDFCKRDWANGLEQMQLVDRQVGELLQRLEDEGLAENTLVFFIGDHGRCHIRGKQFLYDGGIHIPMIIRWPGEVPAGQVNGDMVAAIDICATVLDVADVTPALPLHGQDLFGTDIKERQYIFSARDKMDETHDAMRAVRSKDYKLIHNLMPERPYCQYNRYKEGGYPMLAELSAMFIKGELTPAQAAFMAPTKPAMELYDLRSDPYEINNLASDAKYQDIKEELLGELESWRLHVIHDKGVAEDFRAADIFPVSCPGPTVDKWVETNESTSDFSATGWPAWYPTRTLVEWEKAREIWRPYVFREAGENVHTPQSQIIYSKRERNLDAKFLSSEKYFQTN